MDYGPWFLSTVDYKSDSEKGCNLIDVVNNRYANMALSPITINNKKVTDTLKILHLQLFTKR